MGLKGVAGSAGLTIGTTTITGGATTEVLYNLAGVVQSSSGLTYAATASVGGGPRLTIGSGSAGSAGFYFGSLASGYSGIWSTAVTPSDSNFILYSNNGGSTTLNAATAPINFLISNAEKMSIKNTAGQGFTLTGGTATTDVGLITATRTNNNAAVATGVKWTFTDTSSAAGFLPFQILSGSAGTTNVFSVPKEGGFAVKAKVVSGTAPTLASGGCTTPTAVTDNGTAAFSVGVGTSCSGSQPLVFTLPAATTGWQCTARNQTSPAGSSPAMSSTVSTTSVTITNYSRTLGTAAAWTDADVVVVSCMGY